MRTATRRGSRRLLRRLVLPGAAVLTIVLPRPAPALVLDDRGEMRLGVLGLTRDAVAGATFADLPAGADILEVLSKRGRQAERALNP